MKRGDCAPKRRPGEARGQGKPPSLRNCGGGWQRPSLFILVVRAGLLGAPGLGGRRVADFAPRPRRRDPRLRGGRRFRRRRAERGRGDRGRPHRRRGDRRRDHFFVENPGRLLGRSGRRGDDRHGHDGRSRRRGGRRSRGRNPGSGLRRDLGRAGRCGWRGRRSGRFGHEDLRGPRRRRHDPRDGVLRRGARRKRREHGPGRSEREKRRPASGTVHRRLPCCPRSLSGERPTKEKGAPARGLGAPEREKGANPGAGQSFSSSSKTAKSICPSFSHAPRHCPGPGCGCAPA